MSEKPPPRRTKSGETEAVKAFRAKLESITEGTFPILEELNRQADELQGSIAPPKDPRRDGDSEPPIDVVFEDPEQDKEPNS